MNKVTDRREKRRGYLPKNHKTLTFRNFCEKNENRKQLDRKMRKNIKQVTHRRGNPKSYKAEP